MEDIQVQYAIELLDIKQKIEQDNIKYDKRINEMTDNSDLVIKNITEQIRNLQSEKYTKITGDGIGENENSTETDKYKCNNCTYKPNWETYHKNHKKKYTKRKRK